MMCAVLFWPIPNTFKSSASLYGVTYQTREVISSLAFTFFFYHMITSSSESGVKSVFYSRYYLPLSRLSYSAYILQPIFTWHNLSQVRDAVTVTWFFQVNFKPFKSLKLRFFLFLKIDSIRHNSVGTTGDFVCCNVHFLRGAP